MRWWQWVLVVLLVAGALRALVGEDEPEAPSALEAEEPSREPPPADTAGLQGTGDEAAERSDARVATTLRSYGTLPVRIQKAQARIWGEEAAKELAAWVAAEPRRLLTLLASHRVDADVRPSARRMAEAYRVGTVYATTWRQWQIELDLAAFLDRALKETGHCPWVRCALVGVLSGFPPGEPPPWSALQHVATDPHAHSLCRSRALTLLFRRPWHAGTLRIDVAHEVGTAELQTLRAVLEALPPPGPELVPALQAVRKQPELLPPLEASLLALLNRPGYLPWQLRNEICRCLLATPTRSPAIRTAFAKSALAATGSLRKQLHAAVLEGNIEDVLAWMETAPYGHRLTAVLQLQAKGVDVERLRPHLLAVLPHCTGQHRERAVGAIPLLGIGDDEVLPVAETLLQRDKAAYQVIGIKALGILAHTPGDHSAAVQRLFRASTDASSAYVRRMAVQSILMHQAQPRAMVEMLSQLLGDTEADVRREAADALGELAGEHADARRALEGARNDSDDDVRALIAYWLEQTNPDDD